MAGRYGEVGLDSPLRDVGIGKKSLTVLADKLTVHTVGDLLRYYPRKYTQRGDPTDLANLEVGEKATVWARVLDVSERKPRQDQYRGGRRSGVKLITTVTIGDGHHTLTCAFFNQFHIARILKPGVTALFSGTVKEINCTLQLSSPQWAVLKGADMDADIQTVEEFSGIIPIYPLTEGLTQGDIQHTIKVVLELLGGDIADPVPAELLATHGFAELSAALNDIHRPRSHDALADASAAAVRRGAGGPAGAGPAPRGARRTSRPNRAPGSTAGCSTPSTRTCPSP